MLPRFQHVLVPLDFTEQNQAALEVTFQFAVRNHARVSLLHVIEPLAGDDTETRAFLSRLRQRAASELESRARRFQSAGQQVEWKVIEGHRLEEIVKASVDRHADLVLMSSHPLDPARPAPSWNTLSDQVSV